MGEVAFFWKSSRAPKPLVGWEQSSTQSLLSSCFLAGFPGNSWHIYLCGVICFPNCMAGESAIWLQKVIWQFIFRAALLPAACFKLNLWHKDIHHFNCVLLFSQAQIRFIFFFLSPMGFFFFFPEPPFKKAKNISLNQALFIVKEFLTLRLLVFQCCIFGS